MAPVSELPAPAWAPIPGFEGAWTLARLAPSGWSWRAVAVALPAGGLAVYSPVAGTVDATSDWLSAQGGVRFVLAPSHFHHLGVPEMLARFPEARLVASEVATPRLARTCDRALEAVSLLTDALPETATVLAPPGLKSGEVWLRLDAGDRAAWVVSDAFFHVTRRLRGRFGLAVRLIGAGPGLRIGRTFTGLAVGDRRAYRTWLRARLEGEPLQVLVPGHGEILEDAELSTRLATLIGKRL